jgi:hypothetical protein
LCVLLCVLLCVVLCVVVVLLLADVNYHVSVEIWCEGIFLLTHVKYPSVWCS